MSLSPPPALVELLERLGLAAPAEVLAVQSRVRKLARGMPSFEQVWVDALAQARVLTAFQAGEINGGRAAGLKVGPYVLVQPIDSLGWAVVFRARELATGRDVRLTMTPLGNRTRPEIEAALVTLVRRGELLKTDTIERLDKFGFDTTNGERLWATTSYCAGQSAAEWMVHHGRFTPPAVTEIVRQLVSGLLACEQAGIVHGDLGARQLLLAGPGWVRLTATGLRGIVRPTESYAAADLLPEAYDYLAPERVADGLPPTAASDTYALGALAWHLLAGRSPIPGANGLAKLSGTQTHKIADIAQLAPETPPVLADFVRACMQRDPRRRPVSLADWAQRLGPSTRASQLHLARQLEQAGRCRLRLGQATTGTRLKRNVSRLAAAGVGLTIIVVAGTWPQWQSRVTQAVVQQVTPAENRSPTTTQASTPTKPRETNTPAVSTQPAASIPKVAATPERPGPWPGSTWQGRDLVLSSTAPTTVSQIALEDGQTIRAAEGQRATVIVPTEGWRLDGSCVRLENLDLMTTGKPTPVLVQLAARRAEFQGCSWQSGRGVPPATALEWLRPEQAENSDTLLAGDIHLEDCLLEQVSAGLRYDGRDNVALELTNVLYLGPGPLVQLDGAPRRNETLEIIATHLTLREAAGLLVCRYDQLPVEPGRIRITTVDSALIPTDGMGLLVFDGATQPTTLLEGVDWTGQGSVLPRQTPLAVWREANGTAQAAPDDAVNVAGLVRSDVGFAGAKQGGPSASRVIRWQVPLQSSEPPGIREQKPLPGGMLR